MNYIYYNEFGKEVKKLIMPIAKGSSNIKIIIFSDLDNMASSPYKVTAAFKRADGLVAGDIALSNSVDKKTNPYNQVEMYYRELVIGNDLTELVGGLELSLKYVTTESIEVESNVFYDEDTIRVQAMAVFNIYNAVSFITPPQNTQLVNLRNYVDAQNIIIFNEYDGKLFLKADKIDTYLKSEVYNKDESYNKTEINNLNDLKANASEVFSKEETYNRDTINDLVADVPNKANIVILQSITTQPATATVGQIYYNAYDKKIYLYDGSDWGVNNVGANGILYMFNNVLYVYNTYDGLIKIGQKPAAFNTLYVDSLSSNNNDFNYLTVENQIIANSGIDVKSHKIINVQDPTANQDAATKKYVDDSITTSEGNLDNYYTKVQTYSRDEIIDLIASNYKAKGNLAPAGLVAGLLVKANLGNVYNITGQFTTTINFLEGAGIIHEAGENVAIVEYSAGVYKFDVLSSFVDLSGYVEKTTKVAGYDLQDDITVEEMETALGLINYVLKDGDKVLSTEDYTSEEKTKLGIALVNTLKIAGITVDDDISVEDLKAALVLVKGDVGLGNVENYDIATKVLAELGESNIKYMTPIRTKEAIDYNLIPVNTRIDTIADLSPYHYEGTFIGDDTMQSILRPLEAGGGDDTFVVSKLKGAMFVCETDGAFTFSSQYTWSEEVGSRVDTIIYNFLPPYQDDSLLPSTNFKIKDVITIVNFQLGGISPRTITLTMQVEKNLEENFVVKNDTITGSTKTKITYDAKGLVTAGADLIADDIPTLPQSKITDLVTDLGNKQATLTFDSSPTSGSTNPVTSGGVYTALNGKVDKIEGKGLSTEDYTTNEKNKLAGLTAEITVETWNTATKTLALSDANKLFKCSHTTDQTLTIPTNATVAFPIGTMITFLLTSTYTVTFVGASGVTLTSIDSLVALKTQFAMASLIKTDTDTWQLVGALE